MKKIKLCSLLMSITMLLACFSILTPVSAEFEDGGEYPTTEDTGINVSKTAIANEDGTYTITLEAYATGDQVTSTISKDVPTDIVLVIDQSGSMRFCMKCGQDMRTGKNHQHIVGYEKTYDIHKEGTYYYKLESGSYNKAYYCDFKYGQHAGWYTEEHKYFHNNGERLTPKSSENDISPNGTQFYLAVYEDCSSRLDALKNSVNLFVKSVYEKAAGPDKIHGTNDDISHRISIIGFANGQVSNSDTEKNYLNTEILSLKTPKKYGNLADSDYANSLVDISAKNSSTGNYEINPIISNSINSFDCDGSTYINLGIEMANKVFTSHKSDYDVVNNPKNKVTIVFTDGSPGYSGYWGNDYYDDNYYYVTCDAEETAREALQFSYSLKNSINATVYTIGIFNGANASKPSSLPVYTLPENNFRHAYDNTYDADNANRFLHLLSSNYPKSTDMEDDNTGSINPKLNGTNSSYYLSAGDSNALNDIFQKISQQINSNTSSTKLDSNAVVSDIISPQFSLLKNADDTYQIDIYTADCTSANNVNKVYTFEENLIPLNVDPGIEDDENGEQKINITGFDFSKNFCREENGNPIGKKLVIRFNVKPKDDFLGGNNVYTNTSAKVYKNQEDVDADSEENPTFIKEFNKPQVNVPIKDVSVTPSDKNVYLLGSLTGEQLKNGSTVTCGDVILDLTEDNYGLESWQYQYVEIAVTIQDADGKEIDDSISNLTNDTTYTINVSITPKSKGDGASGTPAKVQYNDPSAEGKINVYKPVVTFKDSDVFYGDTVPSDYNKNNYVNDKTVWKHNDTLSTGANVDMIGNVPELIFEYTPDSSKVIGGIISSKEDVGVTVTPKTKIGDNEITISRDNITINHDNCEGNICNKGEFDFLLHVHTGSLTITKVGGEDGEPYVFTVYKKSGDSQIIKYTEASITFDADATGMDANSLTIHELPVGEYTVVEDTNWSWRYEGSETNNGPVYVYDDSNEVGVINSQKPSISVEVRNTKNFKYWLNGFSTVVQNIFRKANN